MKRLLAIALFVGACSGSGSGGASSSSAILPLVGASDELSSEEPLATENLASEAPVSRPSASHPPASQPPASKPPVAVNLPVKVTKAPGSVAQGATATVSIDTVKGASCDIDVQYSSGSSKAKGLETKRADANGRVTWKWNVGSNTTMGKWPVTIACALGDRSGDATTSITVK
jgi:micrococcal nuclease